MKTLYKTLARVDVLNLEWCSYDSRDRNSSTLVCNYLRYQGYSVVERSVFMGLLALLIYRPKVVYMSNIVGAHKNIVTAKFAKKIGCTVVTGYAEGNFQDDDIEQCVWGNNTEKKIIEDILLLWSKRVNKLTLDHYPELSSITFVSGCIGFDQYKIINSDTQILSEFDKFKLIVGIGCWDFGIVDNRDSRYEIHSKKFRKEEIDRFLADRDLLNSLLDNIISNNPDVMFILKEHPGNELGRWSSGIDGLEKYKNVQIIKNELPIKEVISISDIWLTYESNTAVEAWLLGKQTALINPTGTDFPGRHGFHNGQPNYKNTDDVQLAIDEYVRCEMLPEFDQYSGERTRIIRDISEWSDGLNHVRVGNIIIDTLEKSSDIELNLTLNTYEIVQLFKQFTLWYILPLFKHINKLNKILIRYTNKWNYNELNDFSKKVIGGQVQFYKSKSLTKSRLRYIKVK